YHIEGRYDEAIEFYRRAIKISPDSAEAYIKLGMAYASKGMNDEAVEAYKEAIKIKILEKLGEL
ncbi:TPA: tetratricopeptide repeat protein, partial [Candidatus Poribacteria bacterium]|nr:tetratricopeptide repeat protein [Candidatus Poribacteria bacterium]HEX28644.1 tetratricopeptide repeat protein [Candidatus Poribacteria bacterium]